MKLNCDMGESFGSWSMGMDEAVMPHIDMANIACGFHASDPLTMQKTVKLALSQGVSIGAHPGYPDLIGFGRREMQCHPDELMSILIYQIGALDGICRSEGTSVEFVKPHGALYNKMMVDDATLSAVMQAVRSYGSNCPLVVMATPDSERILAKGRALGLEILFEAFSDRAYDDEGRLVNRKLPGAVHHTPELIERQVVQIIRGGCVTSISGRQIPIKADTICIHGDSSHAAEAARHMREVVSAL